MKRFLMPATTMTTLKKVAFTLFCGVACGLVSLVLMVSAAMAQVAGGPPNHSSGPAAPLPASGANDPIIGSPPTAGYGNCFPFGCAYIVHYQQVYTKSQFSGPVTITELYFYNTQYDNGATAMNSGMWTISLSTTSADWNTLSTTFSNNIGTDNTQVFSGNLAQSWAFGDTLAIPLTTPFPYNPALGNLLMTVVATDTSAPGGFIFFDSNTANTIMGRVYCPQANGAGVDCGPTGSVDNGFGLVTGYTAVVTQETLTLTELGLGSGNVTDNQEQINCTLTNRSQSGTCSASYSPGTVVTLTETTPPEGSTFGGWGGACASFGTLPTCTLTMDSSQNASASFNAPGPTQAGTVMTGTETVFNFQGGVGNGGYNYNVELTSGPPVMAQVTVIPVADQLTCNGIVNPTFPGAQCFVYDKGNGPNTPSPVMFELTCPGSPGGTCGTDVNPNFFATLGTDFNFTKALNPLFNSSEPLVGWLKGVGPDPLHPCTQNAGNSPPLFHSNQISSFSSTGDPTGSGKGTSGGTGSCWLLTYNTPHEAPSVNIVAPANGGTYQQGQVALANYTCAATGPYLTVASCSAIDTPGGSVLQGAQFDTTTLGPHSFTATVVDSATNTVSQTVTYNVVLAADVAILKLAPRTVRSGTKLTYLIAVGDFGPANAVNVSVNDPLPPGTAFLSASGTNLACSIINGKFTCRTTPVPCASAGGIVSCNAGTIMPFSLWFLNGAVIQITVQVTAPAGTLNNTATVSASNADPKAGNNSSTASTTVTTY